MVYGANGVERFALPLPITRNARTLAEQFAAEQPTQQKADEVRLNTLAVCVINDYLEMLGFSTNLATGDSWNPTLRLCANVADLDVVGVGRLECRPLRPQEHSAYVSPEVWENRMGYAVVQIEDSFQTAVFLGFVPTVAAEVLPIQQLQSPEALIDYLNHLLNRPSIFPSSARSTATATVVNLNQWFQNIFEIGWQAVDSLFESANPHSAYAFRGSDLDEARVVEQPVKIKRTKQINLGTLPIAQSVKLLIELTPEMDCKTTILLQVHPTQNAAHLPPGLQVTLLDESDTVALEAQSRSTDNYVQLEFDGNSGEQFSVRLVLGNASVVETFVI